MSTHIRLALDRDIDAICYLLHEKMNSRIPVSRWRNLMTYEWLAEKPDFGRVVESDGQILGFCGMVYSNRLIADANQTLRQEKMVSMSSWYLDRSLRGKGLGRDMLLSAISDPSLTYSTLTNSRKPLGIVEALGFRVLEDQRYVWKKTGAADSAVSVIDDFEEVHSLVEPHQQQLLKDMHPLPLMPVLIELDREKALMFFSVKSKGNDVIWYDLMYSSNFDLFTDCAQLLANHLLPEPTSVLAADSRFVRVPVTGAIHERLPVARYYISERVTPHEIDHLYSELQLLDLKLD